MLRCGVRLACATLLAIGCRSATAPPEITIAVPYEVTTLDPHLEDTVANFALHANVYDPLVATDGSLRIQPALADRWETPDPNTWVFHLRPGVRFHSGRALRADDVVASCERLRGQDQMRAYLGSVESITAPDDSTVVMKTRRPTSTLLNGLSRVLIVPRGHADLATTADGTGSYAVADWVPGRKLTLRASEHAWAGVPSVARVTYALGLAPDAACAGAAAGTYQLAQCNSRRAVEALGTGSGVRILRHDNLLVKYLGLDLGRAETPFVPGRPNPFRDRRVRQALTLAIDRSSLVGSLASDATPAGQPVPRFVFGFDPTIAPPDTDLVRARALLAAAGVGDGFPVVAHVRRVVQESAQDLQRSLLQIGVRMEPRVVSDEEFYRVMGNGQYSMWVSRFACQSGDASELLLAMVHTPDEERGYGWNNWSGWSDPEMDREIEASATILRPEERRVALSRLVRRVTDELVLLPLYSDQDVYVLRPGLQWSPRNDSVIRAAEVRWAP
jgi:peptide/nickel transport system substrate-binding protein